MNKEFNFKVSAEIVGEFVICETFKSKTEALKYADKLISQGIWDDVDVYKIN